MSAAATSDAWPISNVASILEVPEGTMGGLGGLGCSAAAGSAAPDEPTSGVSVRGMLNPAAAPAVAGMVVGSEKSCGGGDRRI